MSLVSPEKSNLDDCDFWCDTDGDKVERGARNHKTKFVWRVKNFSSRPEQKGGLIESDSFTVIAPNGVATEWKLVLYPEGDLSSNDGYLSVYLQAIKTKARVEFKIFISDENGNERDLLVSSNGGKKFEPGFKGGRRNALLIDQLKEKWLFDDVLTLVCELSVMESFYDIKQNHHLEMMEDLGKAFIEKNSMDVTVNCGGMSFECNKFILAARSPVFKAMFQHDTKENQTNVVNIEDIEPNVLEEMLIYIHTGDAPNINDIAKKLLAAADFYQLHQLKISCQEVLSETLDAENSIELLILSDLYSASKLRKIALKFVSKNMKSVSSACEWQKELAGYPTLMAEIIESLMNIMSLDDTQRGDLKSASS